MKLEKIETPGIAHYAYVIADQGEAAVVDPSRDPEPYLQAARRQGARIRYVVETHRQEDFVMGSSALSRATGAAVVNLDHELFGHGDVRMHDGDRVKLGGIELQALHTPGHTPESTSYAVHDGQRVWAVFTGDALFFGGTGRTDLASADASVENAALLYDSVHAKLADLGDHTLVLPAHGPGSLCGSGMDERPWSTLGAEKQGNPVFRLDRDAFARKKGGERLPRPPFFRHMEKVNLDGGLEPRSPGARVALLGLEAFAERGDDAVLFDTREPEAFAGGHVEDAFSIWQGGLPVFGGWIAEHDTPVHLVCDRDDDVDPAARHLFRIGIDGVRAALAGGFGTWRSSGRDIRRAGVVTPQELSEQSDRFQVLDVREPDEFAGGHISGAHHVYVGHLPERLEAAGLDRDEPVAVTCGVGHRAGLGVSILLRAGFRDVRNLLGGMKAWKALDLPTEEGDA